MSESADIGVRGRIFEMMLLMRRFEEKVIDLAAAGHVHGHFHVYIGQEATGAAAIVAMDDADLLLTTHRNHGHVAGRGADLEAALAEIMGRASGLNGGRAGTLHMTDPSRGILQTSAIVGGCASLAPGAAFALKQEGKGRAAVAFFGEGALEEGVSSEALNLAALWKLPLFFVCENNTSGALSPREGGYPGAVNAITRYTAVPAANGIDTRHVDGTDAMAVHAAARDALALCHAGNGPVFMEAVTERWAGSRPLWPTPATGATDLGMALGETATGGEHRRWFETYDPVLRGARELLAAGLSASELRRIDAAVTGRIEDAAAGALKASMPEPKTVYDHVFA